MCPVVTVVAAFMYSIAITRAVAVPFVVGLAQWQSHGTM
jgi:hypothetical protein